VDVVCLATRDDRQRAFSLTVKRDSVPVVTEDTAVLALGDVGPEAALRVMEGKSMLFKEFGGVNAFPICLATKDADTIAAPAVGAGAAPRRHRRDLSGVWRTTPSP
jgi:malate dehydrogenase (oxaloacetate-decarboxylating)